MTTTKGRYDPVKAVEGMFNGSVTRIAYVLKDPTNYGGSTKTVLAECAKRFQDALDDCEIQLLDAKWFLEQQLRTNELRREAKARETGTATKRKLDETKEANEPRHDEHTASKKSKTQQDHDKMKTEEQASFRKATVDPVPTPNDSTQIAKITNSTPTVAAKDIPQSKDEKSQQTSQNPVKPTEAANLPSKEPEQPAPDDFAKPTPQVTPTGTNDEDFFESMFGEPTGGDIGESIKDDADLEFDFTAGDFTGSVDSIGNQDPASLDTLLPGVEIYANQTDENLAATDNNNTTNDDINNRNNANKQSNNSVTDPNEPDANALPAFSNDFGLPNLGDPNEFDDLLANEGGTEDDNIAFADLDFDTMFA